MPKQKVFPQVDLHNKLSLETLVDKFVPRELLNESFTARDGSRFRCTFETSSSIDREVRAQCFNLVRDGVKEMYDRSEMRWSDRGKKEEMREEGMRFLVLREEGTGVFAGFLSMIVLVDEGEEVLYCYELHIHPDRQGLGLGKYLMRVFEEYGRNVGFVRRGMLTVFTENKSAREFYYKLGFTLDETSPGPRRLRNGVVKQPTYEILSKVINQDAKCSTEDKEDAKEQ